MTVVDIMHLNTYFLFKDAYKLHEVTDAYQQVLDKHPVYVKYIEGLRQKFDEYWETQRIKPAA